MGQTNGYALLGTFASNNTARRFVGRDAIMIRTTTGSQIRYGAANRAERRRYDATNPA